MTRVITTVIGIPLLIFIIEFAPSYVSVAVIYLAMLLALHEYFTLAHTVRKPLMLFIGYLLASALLASFYISQPFLILWMPFSVIFILIAALSLEGDLKDRWESACSTAFGVWYIGGLMSYMVGIRRIDHGSKAGADLLLLLLIIIWANDIFAYLVGRKFGRHKLAPAISPNKTVEGAIGGFVFGILTAIASHFVFVPEISVVHSAAMGAVIGVFGQMGDLCESIVKRAAGVKDSGVIIPGHGGMLDRIDSLLFGAPAMYYYFYLILVR